MRAKMTSFKQEPMDKTLEADIRRHIREKYTGIFSEEHMERHFQDYTGFELAETQLRQVQDVTGLQAGQKLLDIGCGYGSFVLVCRNAGIEAEGLDIADYDIGFARRRFEMEGSQLKSGEIFHLGDGQNTGLPGNHFDVVTAWNLLEHVPDFHLLIGEAYRLLKPGGTFIAIAPNYFSFRQEAHYHVPWYPFFPREWAHRYLVKRGLNPSFFDQDIHYVSSWGIESTLRKTGFKSIILGNYKLDHPEVIHSSALIKKLEILNRFHLTGLVKILYWFEYWNPMKPSIYLVARKPA